MIGKLCGKNGDMQGWYIKPFMKSSVFFLIVLATRELHSVELSSYTQGDGCGQAKIILTRTRQLYSPLDSPVIGPVAKSDEAYRHRHIAGF